MSTIPIEFVELIAKKRELEQQINEAIKQFETSYKGIIKVDGIDFDRLQTIGGNDHTTINITMRVA